MKLKCIWDNVNLKMHFCLQEDSSKEIHIKALCFTSLTRIKSFNEDGLLKRQEAYFHHIEPQNKRVITQNKPWILTVKEFYDYEGYIFYPLRLSDGPKTAYMIIEEKGELCFMDLKIDFSFTNPLQKVQYNASSLTIKTPKPAEYLFKNHKEPSKVSITPKPSQALFSAEELAKVLTVDSNSSFIEAFKVAQDLVENLWGTQEAQKMRLAQTEQAHIALIYKEQMNRESYEIKKQAQGSYVIKASHHSGFLYAFISLYHHLIYSEATYDIKSLIDTPRFDYRGCHLDVARKFYSVDELKAFLQEMAWFKLNQLHFHFSDDEAWRIEIKALPELVQLASFSGHNEKILPIHCASWQKSGGYYTQEEIRELISYAKDLNIHILPELDMPGHSYAILQSLPYLREEKKTKPINSAQGYSHNLLNPALPETYEFLEIVLKELCTLFPHPYFHLGGDEVPHKAWMDSDICKELATKENFEFTTENLQSYIMRKAQNILEKNGKKSCGWEEASHGKGFQQDKNAYLILWSDLQKGKNILSQGYNLIISPGSHYYLDMAQSDDIADTGLSWAGSSDVQKTYLLEPILPEFEEYKSQIWGIQACIWGSDYNNYEDFHYMVYPRLMAVAETAWSKAENKNWPNFQQRLQRMKIVEKQKNHRLFFIYRQYRII